MRRVQGPLLAIAVFCLATAWVYAGLWQHGPQRTLAVVSGLEESQGARVVRVADATFEAWLVARNARTLSTRPLQLFDAEHCAPAEKSLAFGIPMIAMGAVAIPWWYATHDPLASYNGALVSLTLLAAFAMYALVSSWTGRPAAGVVAGLLFAFHPIRIADVTHPSVWDASWTVLGMLFAERWLARGHWRDAAALAAAIALQIAASFYPLLAATFALPPLAVWLLLRRAPLRATPAQALAVALASALAAAVVLGPYLAAETDHGALQREKFAFAPLFAYLPGQRLSLGALLPLLAASAFVPALRRAPLRIAGDPRWPLLAGAALVALVASGPFLGLMLPGPLSGLDLYGTLARALPGLDAVRGVLRLSQGALLLLCVLAGLGTAGLLARAGRLAPVAAALLIALAGVDVLRPEALGFAPRYAWSYETVEPDSEALVFFAQLEQLGDRGPILELPLRRGPSRLATSTRRILLSTWHGRRTSACFGSYEPAGRAELAELARRLPEPDAIRALARLGFTTVVLEPAQGEERPELRTLMKLHRAAMAGAGLEELNVTPRRVAWRLRPELLPEAPPPEGS